MFMISYQFDEKCGFRPPVLNSTAIACLLQFLFLCLGGHFVHAQEDGIDEVAATSCFLRTYEEADVPALTPGLITDVSFQEGEIVRAADVLALLDDAEARIQVEKAQVQLELARKEFEESFDLQIAEAKVKETEQLIDQSKLERRIAEMSAQSSVNIRKAEKALDTAQAELDRALAARKEFAGSVSDTELNQLEYRRDTSRLDIESAKEQKGIAALERDVKSSAVGTAEAILERLRYEREQAMTDRTVQQIDLKRLELELELAETKLLRRRIVAPFDGMIVEQYHHRGEWLEPGRAMFRIVRLDRLIVEGFADAKQIHHSDRGARVRVQPQSDESATGVEGKLIFVSPEIDPVNQQVQVRAIVNNQDGNLRAGEAVEMVIQLEK